MARRDFVRLILVPALLLTGVSALVFALAKLHPAKPEVAAATGAVRLGDAQRGARVFQTTCAGCHGADASGGIGPPLAGATLSLAQVKAQIDNGGGTMPAGLVRGQREEDVLAYLETILAPAPS